MPIMLLSNSTPVPAGFNMLDDGAGSYWFHHLPSFPRSNPRLYKEIISNAQSSIEIWDPYFHKQKDHLVFDSVHNNVAIKILTTKGLTGRHSNYMIDVYNDFQALIPAIKNVTFCIGVIDLSDFLKKNGIFMTGF